MADLPPWKNGKFRFLYSLRAHMWQTRWQIYPFGNGNFRFLLIDPYSESSDVADQVADLLPPTNGNFRFLLIGSYSELTCGRSVGRSTP